MNSMSEIGCLYIQKHATSFVDRDNRSALLCADMQHFKQRQENRMVKESERRARCTDFPDYADQ